MTETKEIAYTREEKRKELEERMQGNIRYRGVWMEANDVKKDYGEDAYNTFLDNLVERYEADEAERAALDAENRRVTALTDEEAVKELYAARNTFMQLANRVGNKGLRIRWCLTKRASTQPYEEGADGFHFEVVRPIK